MVITKLKKNLGFTIIELMIGATIGLLILLVIVNTIISTNKQKKRTSSINDAQSGGQIANYFLNRDLRMAGYGLTQNNFSGCSLVGSNSNGALDFDLQPVFIDAGADINESDELTLFYSSSDTTTNSTKLMLNYDGATNSIKVDNRFGFMAGDLAVLFSPSKDIDSDGIADCALFEITGVPSATAEKDFLYFNTGNYTNKRKGQATTAQYNSASGTGISYNVGTRVINLGDNPVSVTYKVEDNELKRINNFTNEETVLADNVDTFKAYFVKDTDLNLVADQMDQTNPGINNWRQIIGVRFSVVTKSSTRDEDIQTQVTVVPATKLAVGETAAVVKDISGDDRYYRFRTYGGIVPFRNVLWRQ